ncbi:LPS translocon maturation chaperone LptM [Herbaspirillum robiniae]|uniref:LPS translocon maturation chaperone LptM n=1 Tax=Herbaspirillum robiniae TaxID=2014887 RepID=UPI003D772F6B
MKSHYSLARRAAALATFSSLLILAGCGQKGPLYMPRIPPDPLVQTTPKPADAPAGGAVSKPDAADSAVK